MSNFRRLCRGILIAIAPSLVSSFLDGASGLYRNGSIIAPCDSPLFCYGQILHAIQMARPFADSKTFVDMPSLTSLEDIQSGFSELPTPVKNGTELLDFLREHFQPAGSELMELSGQNMTIAPTFLEAVGDKVISDFVENVMLKWNNLTRQFNTSSICDTCQSSFIPPRRPFVVAGGRFREIYYWDSYWIIQGLLRTAGSFTQIAKNQILNFLDFVEQFGFVPNGGRKYYLNRSQPPLLAQMVREYVDYTGDSSILERAVPLLMREHQFFMRNRSVRVRTITDPTEIVTLNQYAVENNQPRPESYREDYEQARNVSFVAPSGMVYEAKNLSREQQDFQYRNLASGAESGWDFTSRFLSRPYEASEDDSFPLRSNNIVNIVPVELNAFLYWNEITISMLLAQTGQFTAAAFWEQQAHWRRDAMHAVFWNATLNSYLDYNISARAHVAFTARDEDALPIDLEGAPTPDTQLVFHVGQLLPFLTGAALPSVASDPAIAKRAFARIAAYLDARPGGIPATNFRSTQQWDQPNVWPPHMQLLIAALERLSADAPDNSSEWAWAHELALELAQRYLDSTYCTWRGTGGETGSTPFQPGLNESQLLGGLMFEKYSDAALNQAGGGGEYEVVVGFGWTNGVLIWIADKFRNELQEPPCGPQWDEKTPVLPPDDTHGGQRRGRRAVELDPFDATWISKSAGGRARRWW